MAKKITIKDVARTAGVSVSAVSRVFNDYGDISEETRQKVLRVSQKLGYVPNNAARQLSSKRKKIIALILNEIRVTRGVAMAFEILGGVVDAVDATDYEFVFYATNSLKQRQKTLKQFCEEHDISGIIIQGLRLDDPYYAELEHFDLPTVAIDMPLKNKNIGNVSIDNRKAEAEVISRLQAAGYQKVLFINGTAMAAVSREREQGVRDVLEKPTVLYADFLEEKAFSLVYHLSNLTEFDAIVAASDLMAIGVIKALRQLNLTKKIAVVGFDDITLASYITPTLTTVRQDMQKFTDLAVKDLVAQIETGQVVQHFVPYEIIVRESAKI